MVFKKNWILGLLVVYMAIKLELQGYSNSSKSTFLSSYFKTREGEYGHGDIFLGISVPDQRKVAKKYWEIPLEEVEELLHSKIHEYRFTALEILVIKYESTKAAFAKASASRRKLLEKQCEDIVQFYLRNKRWVNNWDLVDTSARYILGDYLLDKKEADKKILYTLAKSKNLWDRRIAIVATHQFIYNDQFKDTFKIVEILLNDPHDLIHKACGWMLREVGNRDREALLIFLNKHYTKMPRTMLRYAIEKFEPGVRKLYLQRDKLKK
jgi:3-methyladenine DNA glycosylase AlkD